ncbi:MAG: hypothetical protein GY804_09355 [Alphaproteobacteria bacterium]|nr:hypothetical protein [Alphaproteobacteria bacterium]
MSVINASKALEENIKIILSSNGSNIPILKARFSSGDGLVDVNFTIDTIDLIKDFENGFMDTIEIDFQLCVNDYLQIYNHQSDLICTISIFKTDRDLTAPENAGVDHLFFVILNNPKDIFKLGSREKFLPKEKGDDLNENQTGVLLALTAQLVDTNLYNIRKSRANGLYTEVTVEDILKLSSHLFGISRYKIAKPDNDRVYNNFLIPPMHDISTLVGYIQQTYGIYGKGCTYYIHNDCLYVYPTYDTEIGKKWATENVHVYSVDPTTYMNCDCYHKIINKDLHIVSNTVVFDMDNKSHLSENVATSVVINPKDKLLNQTTDISPDHTKLVIHDHNKLLTNEGSKGVIKDTLTFRLGVSKGNEYPIISELNRCNTILTGCGWNKANPFDIDIRPGQQWTYHYDGEDGYKTVNASCNRISFHMAKANRTPYGRLYTTHAVISMYTE